MLETVLFVSTFAVFLFVTVGGNTMYKKFSRIVSSPAGLFDAIFRRSSGEASSQEIVGELFNLVLTYLFLMVWFVFSLLITRDLVTAIGQGLDPGKTLPSISIQSAFVDGAFVVGLLFAFVTRIFSIYVSLSAAKAVYLQSLSVLGVVVLWTFVQPAGFSTSMVDMITNSQLSKNLAVYAGGAFGTVIVAELFLIPHLPKGISIGAFREKKESFETATVCLLPSAIDSWAVRILVKENSVSPITEIRWIARQCHVGLCTWLSEHANQLTIMEILGKEEVLNEICAGFPNIAQRANIKSVQETGNLCMMLIDDRIVINGLPKSPERRTNYAVSTYEDYPLHESRTYFERRFAHAKTWPPPP